jgi:hypothetical protein
MSEENSDHPNIMKTKTDERIFMCEIARQARNVPPPIVHHPHERSRRARVLREVEEAFSALRATQFEELRRENNGFAKGPITQSD